MKNFLALFKENTEHIERDEVNGILIDINTINNILKKAHPVARELSDVIRLTDHVDEDVVKSSGGGGGGGGINSIIDTMASTKTKTTYDMEEDKDDQPPATEQPGEDGEDGDSGESDEDQSGEEQVGEPGEGQPGEGQPGEGQPGEGQPGEGQPGEGQPGDEIPSDEIPGEGQPSEGQPFEGQPSDEPPKKTVLIYPGPNKVLKETDKTEDLENQGTIDELSNQNKKGRQYDESDPDRQAKRKQLIEQAKRQSRQDKEAGDMVKDRGIKTVLDIKADQQQGGEGSGGGGLTAGVVDRIKGNIDWKSVLKHIKKKYGSKREDITKPHKRRVNVRARYAQPRMVKRRDKVEDIIFAIDTSGSCMIGDIYSKFVGEVKKVFIDMPRTKAWVVFYDTKVTNMFELDKNNVDLLNNPPAAGGTAMECVVPYIEENYPKLNVNTVIFFTDGWDQNMANFKLPAVINRKRAKYIFFLLPGGYMDDIKKYGKIYGLQ